MSSLSVNISRSPDFAAMGTSAMLPSLLMQLRGHWDAQSLPGVSQHGIAPRISLCVLQELNVPSPTTGECRGRICQSVVLYE
jgi:hypothetical protein